MSRRLIAHLHSGAVVESRVVQGHETTPEEWKDFQGFIEGSIKGGDPWHLSVDLDRPGCRAIIAGEWIEWVEFYE